MVLGIVWACLIGADLRLERYTHGLRPAIVACAVCAVTSRLIAPNMLNNTLSSTMAANAVMLAAAGVCIAAYLTITTSVGISIIMESKMALIAACAFGHIIGLDAPALQARWRWSPSSPLQAYKHACRASLARAFIVPCAYP